MTHEDINRIIISFLLVFLAALVIVLSLKLGARQREVRDLREQISISKEDESEIESHIYKSN